MKNVLALLADWANGLFALAIAHYSTGVEILWWYIPIALALSHLPDIDALPELLRRGKVSASADHVRDHRTFLHYPVVALLVCAGALWYGGFWGILLAVIIPLHLLNDLYGTGWGLQLFWPLSHSHYKLLGRRVNRLKSILKDDGDWDRLSVSERSLQPVVVWKKEEFSEYIKTWGVDDWIERWYLRLNWISATEYFLFLTSILLVGYILY